MIGMYGKTGEPNRTIMLTVRPIQKEFLNQKCLHKSTLAQDWINELMEQKKIGEKS